MRLRLTIIAANNRMCAHVYYQMRRSKSLGARIATGFILACVASTLLAQSSAPNDRRDAGHERHKRRVAAAGLKEPRKKEIAMRLVSCAENSSLDWKAQYAYIEYNVEGNEKENRGYTAGIIGFTSKTHDMLEVVEYYEKIAPGNRLSEYLPA